MPRRQGKQVEIMETLPNQGSVKEQIASTWPLAGLLRH